MQFAIFAMLAVAFASPKPDVLTYAAAPGVLPVAYSAYSAPLAYSAPYAAAPVPYAYTGYSGYYVRWIWPFFTLTWTSDYADSPLWYFFNIVLSAILVLIYCSTRIFTVKIPERMEISPPNLYWHAHIVLVICVLHITRTYSKVTCNYCPRAHLRKLVK